jgi:hypothetical protein
MLEGATNQSVRKPTISERRTVRPSLPLRLRQGQRGLDSALLAPRPQPRTAPAELLNEPMARDWPGGAVLALEELAGDPNQAASADDDRRSPASALAAVRVLTRSLRACA